MSVEHEDRYFEAEIANIENKELAEYMRTMMEKEKRLRQKAECANKWRPRVTMRPRTPDVNNCYSAQVGDTVRILYRKRPWTGTVLYTLSKCRDGFCDGFMVVRRNDTGALRCVATQKARRIVDGVPFATTAELCELCRQALKSDSWLDKHEALDKVGARWSESDILTKLMDMLHEQMKH